MINLKKTPKQMPLKIPLTVEEADLLNHLKELGITHIPGGTSASDSTGLYERDGIISLLYYSNGATKTRMLSLGNISWEKAKDLRDIVRKTFPTPQKNKFIDFARRVIENSQLPEGVEVTVKVKGLYRQRKFTSKDSFHALNAALDWRTKQATEMVEKSNTGKERRFHANK